MSNDKEIESSLGLPLGEGGATNSRNDDGAGESSPMSDSLQYNKRMT